MVLSPKMGLIPARRPHRGFTLIELLVVVALLALGQCTRVNVKTPCNSWFYPCPTTGTVRVG